MLSNEKIEVDYPDSCSPITKKAMQYITSHLNMQLLSVKEIADKLYISEATLSKRFKNDMGIAIKKYMDDQIFFEAEKLLLKTNWPLSKISENLGFCDQFYFTRKFKKRYNCTPSEYRKHQIGLL